MGRIHAQDVSPNAALLKPFQSSTSSETVPAAQSAALPAPPKDLLALSGTWKGTFTHSHPDKTTGETTYLVKVDPLAPSIAVIPVVSSTAVEPAPLPPKLQPVTPVELLPAVWDGSKLLEIVSEESDEGDTHITVEKRIELAPGKDKKHARFSYEIKVVSVAGPRTTTVKTNGSGVLSRVK